MKKFHFISGLPRSGTTLLSTILNQNPAFEASISGPLARFSRAILEQSSAQGGYRFQCDEQKRKNIIQSIFDTYYNNPQKDVAIDTNRGWTLLLPMLRDLFPTAKVLCCVRDIAWILDSFETLIRKNPYAITTMFTDQENVNVYTRCNALLRDDRPIGFAYNALKQAITSNENNMLMLIEYERLCKQPKQTIQSIYNFIGQPYFEHDFNNVEISYDEFDNDVNLKGLHTTRRKVEWIERKTILPPDIIKMVSGSEIWR